jgi:hypothetical protein
LAHPQPEKNRAVYRVPMSKVKRCDVLFDAESVVTEICKNLVNSLIHYCLTKHVHENCDIHSSEMRD